MFLVFRWASGMAWTCSSSYWTTVVHPGCSICRPRNTNILNSWIMLAIKMVLKCKTVCSNSIASLSEALPCGLTWLSCQIIFWTFWLAYSASNFIFYAYIGPFSKEPQAIRGMKWWVLRPYVQVSNTNQIDSCVTFTYCPWLLLMWDGSAMQMVMVSKLYHGHVQNFHVHSAVCLSSSHALIYWWFFLLCSLNRSLVIWYQDLFEAERILWAFWMNCASTKFWIRDCSRWITPCQAFQRPGQGI